ncbi:MAG: hypothetical protein JWM44_1991 [Bacilli bacterium]|nr:hypothetical protein [Bacilli bacterium]
MSIFQMRTVTNKQKIIVKILFEFRGVLYDQLIEELSQRFTGGSASLSFIKNTYKDLQKLEELRFIVREPIKLSRTKDMIYLSEAGHEYAKELIGIVPGYIGSGWDEDWGDFHYELQRPPRPSSAAVYHHLMLAEVLLKLERIKNKHLQLRFDYRDNRYNSIKFEYEGQTHRFKPDGDIVVNSQRILIEVDRGTEFGDKLREKFETYKYYLHYLQTMGEELPVAVLFICNKDTFNGMQRRWALISNSFWEEMVEWRTRFNLIGSNEIDLEKVLLSQADRKQKFDDFFLKISRFRTDQTSFGILNAGQGLNWNEPVCSISQSDSGYRLYTFERVEQYETLGLARIFEWYKWHNATKDKYSDMKLVEHFIPVLVQLDGKPFRLFFKGLDQEKELEVVFNFSIWLNTQADPVWRDNVGLQLQTKNPLDERVIQKI